MRGFGAAGVAAPEPGGGGGVVQPEGAAGGGGRACRPRVLAVFRPAAAHLAPAGSFLRTDSSGESPPATTTMLALPGVAGWTAIAHAATARRRCLRAGSVCVRARAARAWVQPGGPPRRAPIGSGLAQIPVGRVCNLGALLGLRLAPGSQCLHISRSDLGDFVSVYRRERHVLCNPRSGACVRAPIGDGAAAGLVTARRDGHGAATC